jgi:Cysteine rich repeat
MRLVASILVMSMAAGPAVAADVAALREACKADVASLCQGVQPGGGRIKECLKANKDKVSEGCKAAIAAAMKARQESKSSTVQPASSSEPAPTGQ